MVRLSGMACAADAMAMHRARFEARRHGQNAIDLLRAQHFVKKLCSAGYPVRHQPRTSSVNSLSNARGAAPMDENAIQIATNSHRNDELIGLLIGRSDKLVSEGNVEARSLPKKRVVRPPIHVDDRGFRQKRSSLFCSLGA